MVISDQHKYVYVELPNSGSTAVSGELCEKYEGVRILEKHSSYGQFLKVATREQKRYFSFSNIRNPLDVAVSQYCKLKYDQDERYSNAANHFSGNVKRVPEHTKAKFEYIKNHNASFGQFFLCFYKHPYDDFSCLHHKDLNYVIRYENMQEDFLVALHEIGLAQVRELPKKNTTHGKLNYLTYYDSQEVIRHAINIFGPFMSEWGYALPDGWGELKVPRLIGFEYRLLKLLRRKADWVSNETPDDKILKKLALYYLKRRNLNRL